MILVAKHLVLMSLALLLVPLAALTLGRLAARTHRLHRPRLSWAVVAFKACAAFLVPALAQGLYASLSGTWPIGARFVSLALAGLVYGLSFADERDFYRPASMVWGALGGLATAWLYTVLPGSGEGRALCVAVFASAPVLAYRPIMSRLRSRLTSAGPIQPDGRLLR